jgi:hypothetical protein
MRGFSAGGERACCRTAECKWLLVEGEEHHRREVQPGSNDVEETGIEISFAKTLRQRPRSVDRMPVGPQQAWRTRVLRVPTLHLRSASCSHQQLPAFCCGPATSNR